MTLFKGSAQIYVYPTIYYFHIQASVLQRLTQIYNHRKNIHLQL